MVDWKRPTLFAKLSATSIGLTLATSISIAIFTSYRQVAEIEKDLIHEAQLVGEMLALNSEYGIYTENTEVLSGLLASLSAHPDIAYVAILSAQGDRLVSRGSVPNAPSMLERVRIDQDRRGQLVEQPAGRIFDLVTPVISGSTPVLEDERPAESDNLIGFVRVCLSDRRHQAQIREMLWSVLLVTSLLIALAIVASVLVTQRTTRPIHELVEAARSIAAGRLDEPIAVKSSDEVGMLAEVFDVMRKSLDERNRQLHRAAEHALSMAEEANASSAAKTLFLAKMSHELRTPLNAVIGFTEVLIDQHFGPVNEQQQEYLEDISSSGRHLLSLVEDILDLSKVEAGQSKPHPIALEVNPLLEATVRALKETAEKRGVELELSADPALSTISADPRMLRQVLFNLLSNAVKFTRSGGKVTAESSLVGSDWLERNISAPFEPERAGALQTGAKEFVRIAVRDTGIGIAQENLRRIFDAFQQEDNSIGREYGGTGLGLALCKKMVELHQGVIWVDSRRGEGSTFTVAIPLGVEDAARGP
jgi:signal transduction histidine kinase